MYLIGLRVECGVELETRLLHTLTLGINGSNHQISCFERVNWRDQIMPKLRRLCRFKIGCKHDVASANEGWHQATLYTTPHYLQIRHVQIFNEYGQTKAIMQTDDKLKMRTLFKIFASSSSLFIDHPYH